MSEGTQANITGSSEPAQGYKVKVEIVVQPPVQVGVNCRLIPPVVARTDHARLIEDFLSGRKSPIGIASLSASWGDDATDMINGNWSVSGQLVEVHPNSSGNNNGGGGGSSSSRQQTHKWLYFIFAGLSIQVPGDYTFTATVNALDHEQGCCVTVGGKTSRQFKVMTQAVIPGRPSPAERLVLQMLETKGLYYPGV